MGRVGRGREPSPEEKENEEIAKFMRAWRSQSDALVGSLGNSEAALGPVQKRGEPGDAGPQGERGDPGDKGKQGEQGDPGDKGPPGDKGKPGDRGDKGPDGPPGDKGEPGKQGKRGPDGPPGDTGEPGKKGPPGDRGARGERDTSSRTKGDWHVGAATGKSFATKCTTINGTLLTLAITGISTTLTGYKLAAMGQLFSGTLVKDFIHGFGNNNALKECKAGVLTQALASLRMAMKVSKARKAAVKKVKSVIENDT